MHDEIKKVRSTATGYAKTEIHTGEATGISLSSYKRLLVQRLPNNNRVLAVMVISDTLYIKQAVNGINKQSGLESVLEIEGIKTLVRIFLNLSAPEARTRF